MVLAILGVVLASLALPFIGARATSTKPPPAVTELARRFQSAVELEC
jgi:hypothetical protein